MKNALSIIAVFTSQKRGFTGNTAAVLLTKSPLSETEMARLAADFNQPATTFLWPAKEEHHYHVRWFAPDSEIGLCGHGSLAAMAYLHHQLGLDKSTLLYSSGQIECYVNPDGSCSMKIEAIPVLNQKPTPAILEEGLGVKVQEYYTTANKDIVVLGSEEELRNMTPDFEKLREYEVFGYAVTAPGREVDFVSRTIVPHVMQLEDHATGSSHAALAPFWSKRLAKTKMDALQLSRRGGAFGCEVQSNHVILTGNYTLIAEGNLLM
jgi:PhzF family phenazine biosynthesis protein